MSWTSPRTWVAGETVTAALLNTHVRDQLKAIGDAWTTYTPTWTGSTTNPTLGNGTKTGRYIQAGKLIIFTVNITFGSTTTVGSGFYGFGLPPFASANDKIPVGDVVTWDNSGTTFDFFTAFLAQSVTDTVRGRSQGGQNITNALPIAWATSDEINVSGMYEAV